MRLKKRRSNICLRTVNGLLAGEKELNVPRVYEFAVLSNQVDVTKRRRCSLRLLRAKSSFICFACLDFLLYFVLLCFALLCFVLFFLSFFSYPFVPILN